MNIKKLFTAGTPGNILALITGALMTLAFAPFHLYPLAIILPAILFGLWHALTPRQAFWRGFLFGLGMFGTGIYWVFISIHEFGDVSILLSSIVTFGLIAILALFPAFTGQFVTRFSRTNRMMALYIFPTIWVLIEWVRSWIFTGFPWLTLGYSQTHSPLNGYAAIVGVFGISFLVLFSGCLLIQLGVTLKQKNYRNCLSALVMLIVIWSLGAYLNTKSWVTPYGKPVTVSLVQGNIPQEIKWSPDSIIPTLTTYRKLTEPHWNSNIIVWPESAIPIPLQAADEFIHGLDLAAKQHHTSFITGVPVNIPNTQNYYNAVIVVGNGSGYYLKHRLVPFGEYTPMRAWLNKLLDFMHLPMSDFVPATEVSKPLIVADNVKMAAFICYEIAFPEMVLFRDPNINMLLTVSNDAWFGKSIAQAQHLQMAQMRALELRRPILFVSNNGLTAVVDFRGKISAIAPPYVPYVLTGTVQPTQGLTPWQKAGMDPVLFMLVLLLFIAIREERKTGSKK